MTQLDRATLATTVLAALLAAAPARAQQSATPTAASAVDEKAFKSDAPGLYANADLSYVLTAGNSSSSSLGFKGDLTRRWEKQSIGFAVGGIRASSSPADSRYAVGTPDDFEVVVPEAETTAESYYGRGRYDYKLSERLFYTAGAGWERNRFSGIDNRWVGDTASGTFVNDERRSFRGWRRSPGRTGLTVEDGRDGSFVGARLGWDFRQKLFENTTFTHTLVADENLEETDDLRVDAQFGLHVAMSRTLGLKVNWRLLWDNLPALSECRSSGQRPSTLPLQELDQDLGLRSSSASPRPRRAEPPAAETGFAPPRRLG
jgi:putative salt-induced outer membrane protein YdiY